MNKYLKELFKFTLLFSFLLVSYLGISAINAEANDILDNEVQVIDSDKPLTESEINNLINELEKSKDVPKTRATGVAVNYYLVRSGNTTSCELIGAYKATGAISNLWWDSLTVQSPSVINRKTYKSFPKVLRGTNSKKSGTVSIGFLSIPKNVKSAYLKVTGTKADSNKDGWGSLVNFNGSIKMN